MKCSILLCARERPKLLTKCIQSVWQHSKRGEVEVLVRCDDDDKSLIPVMDEFTNDSDVRFFVGPREQGYNSISKFLEEITNEAIGHWCLYLNDDMTIQDDRRDKSWPDRLLELPDDALVQPEWHHINQSIYQNQRQTGSPAVVRNAWRKLGKTTLEHPFDAMLRNWWEELKLPILNLPDFHTIHNWRAPDA